MDEAERCHRLAFILRGNLLAHGTVAEVIEQAHLTTWSVSGPDLLELAERLRGDPGVEQAVAFGDMLHVSGADAGRALNEPSLPSARSPTNGGGSSPASKTSSSTSWTQSKDERVDHEKAVRVLSAAVLGDGRQGIHPDAPGPADLRDDDRHPADPAHPLRLRHQLGPEAPAGRACSWPTTARRAARCCMRSATAATSTSSARLETEAEAREVLARGEVQFVVNIPEDFTRDLLRGDRPAAPRRSGRDRSGGHRQRPRRLRDLLLNTRAAERSQGPARLSGRTTRPHRSAHPRALQPGRRSRSTTSCPA